jgi:hypothetical protein
MKHEVKIAPHLCRTVTLVLSANEFAIVQHAVEELTNDPDFIWGNADQYTVEYRNACRLHRRLRAISDTGGNA